ncbi:MAG: class I SAM-dependent methyltransferase [Spirochaetaceae bacterium]
MEKKFNPKKLEKLNNPKRLEIIPPDYIWEKLNLSECKTVVDIGAGTGLFSKEFSRLMENGTVHALDISDVMITWMLENVVNDYKGIIPKIMPESKIPLDDQSSDLTIMITLHHELEEPETLLLEALRVLKKGGKVCIIDWKKEDMPLGPPLEIRCSTEQIISQLKSVGFNNIKTDSSLDMFNIVWAIK